ncbi:hypothetical protein F5Y07DRAFT_359943 [Xylaria sp. FL0933]|nr:hypothetical protein F5Y07DRAFT_359943 [Xylaria sp. FL0933]
MLYILLVITPCLLMGLQMHVHVTPGLGAFQWSTLTPNPRPADDQVDRWAYATWGNSSSRCRISSPENFHTYTSTIVRTTVFTNWQRSGNRLGEALTISWYSSCSSMHTYGGS